MRTHQAEATVTDVDLQTYTRDPFSYYSSRLKQLQAACTFCSEHSLAEAHRDMILDEINQMARTISELNATSIHDLYAKSLFLLEYMTDDPGDLICNIAMSMCKDIKTLAGGNQKSQRT